MDFTIANADFSPDTLEPSPLATPRIGRGCNPNPDLRDLLATRIDELPAEEQALLRALYLDGRAGVEVAAMLRLDPRIVRRRGRRTVRRVLSGEFAFVLRQRDLWPLRRRRVANELFIRGRTQRETASKLRLSLHIVRTEQAIVLELYRAFCAAARERGN